MSRTLFALTLAACGRLGFSTIAIAPDGTRAADSSDPADGDGTVDGSGAALSDQCSVLDPVPDPLTITGEAATAVNFGPGSTPDSGVKVSAVPRTGSGTLASMTTGSDGLYSLDVPTGGEPADIKLVFDNPTGYTETMYPARPLQVDPHLTPNLLSDGSLSSVYGAAGVGADFGKGSTVIAMAQDCSGAPMAGVLITLSPGPGSGLYGGSAGEPFPTPPLTSTTLPYANYNAFDQAPGSAQLTVTTVSGDIPMIGPSEIGVGSAGTMTFVVVQPMSESGSDD